MEYEQSVAGLLLLTEAFDTSNYNTLAFMIHPGETKIPTLYIHTYDEYGNFSWANHLYLGNYVAGITITPYKWHRVRIPLGDLGADNRTITGVEIMSDTATTVTFDDIHFGSYTVSDTGVDNDY